MKLKKYRGQHLLTDTNMISRIVEESGLTGNENVIEIGAGTGLLTSELARMAKKVISFEIDTDFEAPLGELEKEYDNLTVRFEDFLKFDLEKFLEEEGENWRIVANIPYHVTSPIIEKIIEDRKENLVSAHLLMQKEVAQRIVSPPGNKDYGRLSVFVQFFCEGKILFTVPPDVFVPRPTVDSALLEMTFKEDLPDVDAALFFEVVQRAFGNRRKTIKNNLKNVKPGIKGQKLTEILEKAGIDPNRRGETFTMDEFARLTNTISSS